MNMFSLQFILTTLVAVLVLRFILSSFGSKGSYRRQAGWHTFFSLMIAWGLAYVIEGALQISKDLTFIYGLAISGGEALVSHVLWERGSQKRSLQEKKRLLHEPEKDEFALAQEKLFSSNLINHDRFGEKGPENS